MGKNTGLQVLPVYYTDNYFTLMPGEELDVKVEVPEDAAGNFSIKFDGWNLSRRIIKLDNQ